MRVIAPASSIRNTSTEAISRPSRTRTAIGTTTDVPSLLARGTPGSIWGDRPMRSMMSQ